MRAGQSWLRWTNLAASGPESRNPGVDYGWGVLTEQWIESNWIESTRLWHWIESNIIVFFFAESPITSMHRLLLSSCCHVHNDNCAAGGVHWSWSSGVHRRTDVVDEVRRPRLLLSFRFSPPGAAADRLPRTSTCWRREIPRGRHYPLRAARAARVSPGSSLGPRPSVVWNRGLDAAAVG